MNGVIDGSLVGLALLASGGYVLLSLGPRSLRRRLVQALSQAAGRAPAFLGLRRMTQRLAVSAGKAQGACGGCDDCGSGTAAAETPAGGEVRVPVEKIGRRA
ncbi:MAG TPA: DUF6587 family protein [Steroidobacteraceae bacterium]|jgi:hypothetical protein